MFLFGSMNYLFWMTLAEHLTATYRVDYFKAILR